MHSLASIDTPVAIIDSEQMERNIDRMQSHLNSLGVRFRPHVKTSKCLQVTQAQVQAGAKGITVSTLKEAGYFFENGFHDQLYAVAIAPHKLEHIATLRQKGCNLKIITDSISCATPITQ
ncbi:MAG: alanine racemase, partial [Saezia sp.]